MMGHCSCVYAEREYIFLNIRCDNVAHFLPKIPMSMEVNNAPETSSYHNMGKLTHKPGRICFIPYHKTLRTIAM